MGWVGGCPNGMQAGRKLDNVKFVIHEKKKTLNASLNVHVQLYLVILDMVKQMQDKVDTVLK